MTGNILIDLAISIIGIAGLVGLAKFMFGDRVRSFDQDRLGERLSFDQPNFAPVQWMIDTDARMALARNDRGEVALIVAHGDDLVTRHFPKGAFKPTYAQNHLTIAPADHTIKSRTMHVANFDQAVWLGQGSPRNPD